ncbi:MAG: hypothetical protein K9M02_08645 [Thiohalocapsa sp.]|nr:hypothetical protein [Thiohalocapsa sp.]
MAGGPLYPVDEVLALLKGAQGQAINLWTRKCILDAQKYGLDLQDLAVLLEEAVQHGRFRGSEWCVQKPRGPWAACDAYQLFRSEWIANARRSMRVEYYLKFSMAQTGQLLLLVSCHLSEDR